MNLEYTFCRYFYAERLLLPFSVEGQVSRSDERYLFIITSVHIMNNRRRFLLNTLTYEYFDRLTFLVGSYVVNHKMACFFKAF